MMSNVNIVHRVLLLVCGCSVVYHRDTVRNATPMCSFTVNDCDSECQ